MIEHKIKETYIKKRGRNRFLKILNLYPSPLSVGMCNLGYNFLLNHLSDSGYFFDRAFIPDDSYTPAGYDSGLSPDKFDVLLISVSYELDLLKIPFFLKKSGITLFSKDRKEGEPIVIIGGPVTLLNINIILPIVDLLSIGEADNSLPELIETISSSMKNKTPRFKIIERCKKIQNIFHNSISKNLRIKNNHFNFPSHSWAISNNYSFKNMFMIEISRGCVRNCPFCMVKGRMGCFKPFPVEEIIEKLKLGFSCTDYFGLTGAAAVYHPKILKIMDFIIKNGGMASFSSMYIERINEPFLEKFKKLGQKTITFGIESINEELRKNIGKIFTNSDIIDKIDMVSNFSIENIKFYIILGMSDSIPMIKEADDLIEFMLFITKKFKKIRFSLSLNPFIPKPGTIWSRKKMANNEYKKIIKYIKKKLSRFLNISNFSHREATICTYINRLEFPSNSLLNELSKQYPLKLSEINSFFKKIIDDNILDEINYEPGNIIELT